MNAVARRPEAILLPEWNVAWERLTVSSVLYPPLNNFFHTCSKQFRNRLLPQKDQCLEQNPRPVPVVNAGSMILFADFHAFTIGGDGQVAIGRSGVPQ
jgi:hypothetical protein